MATLTIELPDDLAQQLHRRGIAQERLEKVVTHVVQELLQEWAAVSTTGLSETATTQSPWNDGATFARQLIANNRDLFDELARL